MSNRKSMGYARLFCGAASAALLLSAGAVQAADGKPINIPPQSLASALHEFGVQSGYQVLFKPSATTSKTSPGATADGDVDAALAQLLTGTGMSFRRAGDVFLIEQEGGGAPQSGSAAGGGAEVEALIVTAQKREEDIQDVPIAISAFTQEDLTRSQVAGGPDLMTQIPNMTFTKTNFTGYSIQIRGIGTQAISATTDPAVAVAFNNTPFIRNRFFEQEFYDLQRVEVLRGPQGTLYGRNATAGVVNIISAKPKFNFEAKASADVANYNSTRIEAMVNIPLVEDAVALRLAGAWTKRDGYSFNELTGKPIDGRDLWSTRLSLRVSPSDRIDANLIWEHFEENDGRLRSGKQLCHKDIVTSVGPIPVEFGTPLPDVGQGAGTGWASPQGTFSQGCKRGSLYSPDAFQTPNGVMLPYYLPIGGIGFPAQGGSFQTFDPYASATQSRDLRVIESTVDPEYRAKSDLGELQISFDITDELTLQSETAYSADSLYSMQDFNRFNTRPGAFKTDTNPNGLVDKGFLDANGFFCDPQLGCSDRLVLVDVSSARSRQFSQELRLSSDYDGPFNFSLGANYLRYDTEDKYYVFINSISLLALWGNSGGVLTHRPYVYGETDNLHCQFNGQLPNDPTDVYSVTACIYVDPNPIGSVNDLGHNYFLSKNPYKLISYAAFGEAYYEITDNLKVTTGLRWTVDKKDAPRIPTQLLAADGVGYPVAEVIEQDWREPTGRLAIDWKPDLAFTDETLVYGSYARGYKAGGANPPTFVRAYYGEGSLATVLNLASETRPKTFEAEFIDAFELGAKNTLLDGTLRLNLAAFYYDYKDYQISEIVDRSAFNRNFDAEVWGLEVEADWRPLESLKLGFKGGYQKTRIRNGEQAIDLMDRTAGNPDWEVVRPFPTQASSCVLPAYLYLDPARPDGIRGLGAPAGGFPAGCELAYLLGLDPVTERPYEPDPTVTEGKTIPPGYPGFNPLDASQGHNLGEGFFKQLGGNELPNAPNWTATLTGDYTTPLGGDWLATLHTDLHWQSESWWRIFNDHEYNKIDEYFTMNLAAIFTNEEAGWNVMAYVKNVTDEAAITGAFLLSDDTALVTNVFLTEPRLYGVRVTKAWSSGPLLGSFGQRADSYPFELELGGQVQRHDAPSETYRPSFMDAFTPETDTTQRQDGDFDWGDGREVKLTYRPGGTWQASLGTRWGETNRSDRVLAEGETFGTCNFDISFCPNQLDSYFTNYGGTELREGERHTIVDFVVGRDVGLGFLAGTASGGLRYAQLKSTTQGAVFGTPDWDVPYDDWVKYEVEHTEHRGSIDTERTFEGFGPLLSWEGAQAFLGGDEMGRVGLDWSVSAGVLFGKQSASIEGEEWQAFYSQSVSYVGSPAPNKPNLPITSSTTPLDIEPRSKSVTVPTAGVSMGLSYSVGGFKAAAGYRWERYFDAIDGGMTEHKSYDRTIDGPYFKLSVGFGG